MDEAIRQRLLAYILPRRPETDEQQTAMDAAVEAQATYEASNSFTNIPGNVAAMSNDGISVTFTRDANTASYTKDTISPAAWSILRNAGLIAYTLPTARKA